MKVPNAPRSKKKPTTNLARIIKGTMHLLCKRGSNEEERRSKQFDRQIKQWIRPFDENIQILLLGTGESGKTTMLKQMRIMHIQGFTASERLEKVLHIRMNTHEAIYEIVRNMPTLSIALQDPKNISSQQYILQIGVNGPSEFTEDYFDHVRALWKDAGVRACFKKSNLYQLVDSAEYFLDRVDLIAKSDYMPSDADILRCRQKTTGIHKIEFKARVPHYFDGRLQKFWMFDVGGQRGERKKWIQVFEGIHAIWFLVACSDFDQTLREDNTQNRLQESLVLFEDLWLSRFLMEAGLIVFLNKQDILKSKIAKGRSITPYFPEYATFAAPGDEYTRTKLFIKSLFSELTKKQRKIKEHILMLQAVKKRECYFHFTNATDTNSMRTVFKDVHQIILAHLLNVYGMY